MTLHTRMMKPGDTLTVSTLIQQPFSVRQVPGSPMLVRMGKIVMPELIIEGKYLGMVSRAWEFGVPGVRISTVTLYGWALWVSDKIWFSCHSTMINKTHLVEHFHDAYKDTSEAVYTHILNIDIDDYIVAPSGNIKKIKCEEDQIKFYVKDVDIYRGN